MAYVTIGYHFPEEMESDPPANLTKAGLALLTDIWRMQGEPANHSDNKIKMVDASELAKGRPRKSLARVRHHLMKGGYLVIGGCDDAAAMDDGICKITEIGLSKKGFQAVKRGKLLDQVMAQQ